MPACLRILSCVFLLALAACHPGYHDEQQQLTRDDFRQLNNPPADALAQANQPAPPPIPDLLPATPETEKIGSGKIVTISVTKDTPVRDVFVSLGHQADADIEIDPRVQGGVDFSATRRPFEEVVQRLAEAADLRYQVRDHAILIGPDEPYIQTYDAPYLSMSRKVDSDDRISTEVSAPGAASGGAGTFSRSVLTANSETDFYAGLEKSLTTILKDTQPHGVTLVAAENPVDINRQTGLVTVYGTTKQQQAVQEFLRPLKAASSAQVLIEAKVIEVTLNDNYNSGVDWSALIKSAALGSVGVAPAFLSDIGTGTGQGQGTGQVTFSVTGTDLNGIVTFVSSFGTVRTLSSPRITVLNNQTAILKVADNQVFFDVKVSRQDQSTALGVVSTTNPVITVTSDIRTVPIGLVMSVQPSINTATRDVTMTLRPTITRVTNLIDDPAVQYINSTLPAGQTPITAQVPEIQVREFDSVLRQRSGSIAVLGGLMEQSANNLDRGVPGLQEQPIIGSLFKTRGEANTTNELVILLKADIAPDALPDAADRRLYQGYVSDPRPVQF